MAATSGTVHDIALQIEVTTVPDVAAIGTVIEDLKVVVSPIAARLEERGVKRAELEAALVENLDARLFEIKPGSGSGETRSIDIHLKESAPGAAKSKKEELVEEMPFKKLLIASEESKAIRIKGVTGIRRALIRKEKEEYARLHRGLEPGRGHPDRRGRPGPDDHELGLRDLPRLRRRGRSRGARYTRRTAPSPSRGSGSTSAT